MIASTAKKPVSAFTPFSAHPVISQNSLKLQVETCTIAPLRQRPKEALDVFNIVGLSAPMQKVFELIRRAAPVFSTVLILGESGTGKELVADAIHQNSPRRKGPFVAVNCAAMVPSLVESELFGHERGSFTGADERRTGRFEAAHGGTLFIDEIGDFDVSLQVKLLRALETRSVMPVGGSKEIKVDTRVLAATSRDIRAMMSRGQFREDLYYRLNVISIELPPLRRRPEDIPAMVKRFMDRVNNQNGTHVENIHPDLIDALQRYHWRGNVRELLNIVERMIVLCEGDTLTLADLPAFIHDPMTPPAGVAAAAMTPVPAPHCPRIPASQPGIPANPDIAAMLSQMSLEEIEKLAIASTLARFSNNRTRSAKALGISVRTLQRKLGASLEDAGAPAELPPSGHSLAVANEDSDGAKATIPLDECENELVGAASYAV